MRMARAVCVRYVNESEVLLSHDFARDRDVLSFQNMQILRAGQFHLF
jgi:hypothetical protein